MPNTAKMLSNDEHLLPLLQWYLQQLNPDLAGKEVISDRDYEYIRTPDGGVTGVRPDVICADPGGSYNIVEGYWRALAQSLKNNEEMPKYIKVVSIINHSQAHWTCSVATFTLDAEFYQTLKDGLQAEFTPEKLAACTTNQLQHFINRQIDDTDIFHDFAIKGATNLNIDHYDSHIPNNERGGYYQNYVRTLEILQASNQESVPNIQIQSKDCQKQLGNTCGDHSVYNGFVAGVLNLNLDEKANRVDSKSLRAMSEHLISDLRAQRSDFSLATAAEQKVQSMSKSALPNKEPEKPVITAIPSVVQTNVTPERKPDRVVEHQFQRAKATQSRKRARSQPVLPTEQIQIGSRVTKADTHETIDAAFAKELLERLQTIYDKQDWKCKQQTSDCYTFNHTKQQDRAFTVEYKQESLLLNGNHAAMPEMIQTLKMFDAMKLEDEELTYDIEVQTRDAAMQTLREMKKLGVKPEQIEQIRIGEQTLSVQEREELYEQANPRKSRRLQ